MFMSMNHILLKKSTFFERGIFEKMRNFLKNTEFCVKSRLFEKDVIFRTGNFLKKVEVFLKKCDFTCIKTGKVLVN